jgi:hypothetical protein
MADDTKTTPKPEVKKMASTKAQQALEALAKIETLKAEAIQELLADRQKIDDQLGQLGYTDRKPARKRGGAREGAGTVDPTKPCSVCNFLTSPNHDARKHRAQGDNKKPFTVKDLEQFGLKKA